MSQQAAESDKKRTTIYLPEDLIWKLKRATPPGSSKPAPEKDSR